ncbi:hypothetical protein PXK58_08940 [Phaeobacter gallaeciensis]|uniref:hypothetical protein n=1 Tax=Phaeobacter gallaeciensis TaxID=60890 RepID=UPI00238087BF|nr:hypothetical protein [Phaeobacter gallaeciensis]MDE4274749.1 hypothetical protein [Phaeobacter gallaeciensis]MDE4299677.1 hypothetical protein [Phaeobacter gallaeciensis]MDE5184842.1 hypothetical protein [Phaeobacter gallaeciensis]
MTRLEALKELAKKVEAGEFPASVADSAFDSGPDVTHHLAKAQTAFFGSLDAAKALHEAVLPGWDWRVQDMGRPAAVLAKGENVIECRGNTPASAWLSAILQTLIAQEESA